MAGGQLMLLRDFMTLGGLLSLLSGVVALITSYIAFMYQRTVRVSPLNYISFGFLLLGIGLIIQGWLSMSLGLGVGNIYEDARLTYLAGVSYLLLQNVAYLVFAIGYTKAAYWGALGALVIEPRQLREYFLLGHLVFDSSQVMSITLLSIVVFEGLLLESRGGSKVSRLILLSFGFLLASHVIMLYSSAVRDPYFYIYGELVQFVSFALLAIFLLRWSRY
ncbi:hypothetical protein [Acidilobus sp.]|uniref:hypothetical protein n=1 Tax=Acidilobus sp. TaxID=1872109 RepID=UPI003D007B1A